MNNFRTVVIDGRLGYFQRTFHLTGSEVRQFLSNYPPIITWPQKSLYVIIYDLHWNIFYFIFDEIKLIFFLYFQLVIFELKDFAGFTQDECKSIILQQPYVLRVGKFTDTSLVFWFFFVVFLMYYSSFTRCIGTET